MFYHTSKKKNLPRVLALLPALHFSLFRTLYGRYGMEPNKFYLLNYFFLDLKFAFQFLIENFLQ